MSRKDYVAIAEAIATVEGDYQGMYQAVIGEVAEEIAKVFAADNPRFDRERFLAAALPLRASGVEHVKTWQ